MLTARRPSWKSMVISTVVRLLVSSLSLSRVLCGSKSSEGWITIAWTLSSGKRVVDTETNVNYGQSRDVHFRLAISQWLIRDNVCLARDSVKSNFLSASEVIWEVDAQNQKLTLSDGHFGTRSCHAAMRWPIQQVGWLDLKLRNIEHRVRLRQIPLASCIATLCSKNEVSWFSTSKCSVAPKKSIDIITNILWEIK